MALIENTALHVITGAVCNAETALQPVITEEICNQALQARPVITCNRPVVTPLLGMSTEEESSNVDSVTRLESNYVTPVDSAVTTFDDILSLGGPWTDRCPTCGSRAVMPTLLALGEFECWEPSCFAVWTVER